MYYLISSVMQYLTSVYQYFIPPKEDVFETVSNNYADTMVGLKAGFSTAQLKCFKNDELIQTINIFQKFNPHDANETIFQSCMVQLFSQLFKEYKKPFSFGKVNLIILSEELMKTHQIRMFFQKNKQADCYISQPCLEELIQTKQVCKVYYDLLVEQLKEELSFKCQSELFAK